jgi:hypothetical protein
LSRKKRLERLEEDHAVPGEYPKATEKRRKVIREQAELANRCQDRDEPPVFDVTEAGVFCARDGRPVTDPHQTLAEKFYWMEVGFGGEGLVHDEETQEFFTPDQPGLRSPRTTDVRSADVADPEICEDGL